jgi:peptidoglycan/LPS O-acetylase OafA/YrhL
MEILAVLFVGLATITNLDFLIVGAFPGLIYYSVNAKDAFGKPMNSRPSVALGNWSYSIYLWQAPTHYAVMATFAASGFPVSDLSQWSARLLLLATTLVVVGLSAVTYQYFETRARRSIILPAIAITDLGGA